MKKITLLLAGIMLLGNCAQAAPKEIKSDGFEVADGFPTDFSKKKVLAWAGKSTASDYTGGFWNGLFVTDKTNTEAFNALLVEAVPGAGVDGSQCLKITVPDGLLVPTVNAETQESTPNYVAIRSLNDIISFAEGEGLNKYTVTMSAKVDGTTPLDVFRVNKGGEPITVTNEWAEYTLSYYTSGTTATMVRIDLQRANNADYTLYIDNFKIVQNDIVNGVDGVVANDMTVRYNSASKNITVEGCNDIKSISIIDLSGRVVNKTSNGENSVDAYDLTSGLYIVSVNCAQGVVAKKIMVK